MIVDSKEIELVNEKPMRINRIVSVILNGAVFTKLALQNGNNVDEMADNLMSNMSDHVQNNIHAHEFSTVEHSLRKEIGRRINLAQAE